jgi:hypothetical protein
MSRLENTGALCIISDSHDTDDEFNLYNCFEDVQSDGTSDDFSFIKHKVVEFRGYLNKIRSERPLAVANSNENTSQSLALRCTSTDNNDNDSAKFEKTLQESDESRPEGTLEDNQEIYESKAEESKEKHQNKLNSTFINCVLRI